MIDVLIGEVNLLPPVFVRAGDLDDRHRGSLDEFHALNVLFHFLLLQDKLDLAKQFDRVELGLLVR